LLLDFYASMVQYEHHLRPIYDALPGDLRGDFKRVAPSQTTLKPDRIACVAASGDFKSLLRTRRYATVSGHFTELKAAVPSVLFEHGVGYSFHGGPNPRPQASYAGGHGRGAAALLPATNRWVQDANLKAYPSIPSPIVGCPKLDVLSRLPRRPGERPRVCIAFHWDCKVAPETRWAFSWYSSHLQELKAHPDFELVAHGHPRMVKFWRSFYRSQGIRFIEHFADVVAECDVYVNDSSSTLYEAAACGLRVVVLNAPWYRRNVHHGLRFWEYADVGLQVNTPGELGLAIVETLARDPHAEQRRAAVEAVYPYLGTSRARTVQVLRALSEEHSG